MVRLLSVVLTAILLSFMVAPSLVAADGQLDQDIKNKPVDIRTIASGTTASRSVTPRPSPFRTNDVLIDVLPGNGSSSNNARAPQGSRLFNNTRYLITGAEMTTAGFSGAVSSIGWQWNNPAGAGVPTDQGVLTSGTLKVFLKDTTADAVALTGGTFIDITGAGMTKIIDATIDIPPGTAQIDIDVPVGGPGTSTYSHIAGHGVVVIYVYATTTTLAAAATPTVFCNTTVGGNVLYTYQSQTAQGTTGATSTFRPHTRFGGPPPLVDAIAVPVVYALGKIPIPYGVPQTISAPIRNVSATLSGNVDVTLTVKRASDGLVRFTNTQSAVAMAVDDTVIVTFPSWTPTVVEDDSIIVQATSLAGETNPGNNRAAMLQKVNTNRFAYSQGSVASGGVGFTGASGDFVARFTSGTSAVIDSIQVNFSAAGQPYKVGIWDDDGPSGTPGTLMFETASLTSVTGVQTLVVNPAVVVLGDYFIGVKQTGTTNVSFSYQAENPIRPNAFFFTSPTGGTTWTDFSPANGFRFMIEANIAAGSPMVYTSSTATQNTTPVLPGATNQQIIGMQVVTTGNLLPVTATSITFNTNGTTNPATDISNGKIYYTGSSSTFSPVNQFGVTVASPSGSVVVPGSRSLVSGTNYFWLTYDINPGATPSNVVDAEFSSVTVAAVPQTPTVTAPAGNRQIKVALAAGDYTIGAPLFNRITGRSLYSVKQTRRVMREVVVRSNENVAKGMAQAAMNSETSDLGSSRTELREVEEEYTVMMENGSPVTGRLYAPLTDALRAQYGLTDDGVGVYPTITAAVADLNALGVSGAVTFTLLDATYPSETYPLQINQVPGASSTNTIKIRPSTTSTIAGSSASAIFKLNGADYVTIDGSNSGGTDRSLTISNSNAGTSSAVIWVASIPSPRDSATNNTVKNCILSGGTPETTTRYCILSSGSAPGGLADAQNRNNTYQNNEAKRALFGIAVVGPSGNESGMVVTQNTIGVTDTIGLNGIAAFQQSLASITNNTISKVVSNTVNTASGIRFAGTADSVLVAGNRISGVRNNSLSGGFGWGSNGIQLNSSVTGTKITLANNFIWDVRSAGFAGGDVADNGYGIIAVTGGGYRIYHNSVNLNTNQDTLSGRPAAFNVAAAVLLNGIDARNNNFTNSQTVGTERYAVYSAAGDTAFGVINHNNYYTTGANLGFLGATNRVNLAAWQAATGEDANSVSGDPLYVSAVDLHITNPSSPSSNAGTPIASVTTDIDGDVRNASTPDIGADEFAGSSSTTLNVGIALGWNLISNPVTNPIPGDSVRQMYPTSLNAYAFEFAGGYVQKFILANGKGYWEKFPGAISAPVTGTLRTRDSVSVATGWNIVGSISNTVDTNTIVSVPPGLRASNWFGYSSGYTAVTQLVPGKGYWVKSTAAGKFVLANPLARPAGQVSGTTISDVLNTLTITDANGGSQTLYFGADGRQQIPVAMYAMPPAPPVGGFDARFETADGGSMVQTHGVEMSAPVEFAVSVQSEAYPLTITWKVASASYTFSDGVQSKDMMGEGSMKITNSSASRFSVKLTGDSQLPKDYALSQNYPNPFNPTTSIKYALPVDSKVTMEIYNVLGQRVATLLNEVLPAGYHAIEWNSTGTTGQQLGSGVYFLQLSAEGSGRKFSEIRKLMLLK